MLRSLYNCLSTQFIRIIVNIDVQIIGINGSINGAQGEVKRDPVLLCSYWSPGWVILTLLILRTI